MIVLLLSIYHFMKSLLFDDVDIHDDGYFCGWDSVTNPNDSLQFKRQHLVKIVKPMTENKTISNYNRIAVRQSKPIKRNHSNKTIVKPPPKSKHKKKIKKIKDPQAQLQPVKKKNKRKRRTKRNKRKLIKMSSTVITADADQPSTPPRYHSKTIAYPAQLPTPPNYHSNRTVDAPQPNTPRRYYSKNKPHISQNYCTNNTTNESRTNKSINDFISRRKKRQIEAHWCQSIQHKRQHSRR
eukprot:370635_1